MDEIEAAGGRAAFTLLDVTDEQAWERAVQQAVGTFGGLDILVNNAGVGDLSTLEQTTIADYERTIAITQTSGGFGKSPADHAAKGAVRTMTKSAAIGWALEGIRVNSVHPGFIDTAIIDAARGTEIEDKMMDLTPMRRLGRPDEVAAGVGYLASDDASFVTGSELYIDGGYMAR